MRIRFDPVFRKDDRRSAETVGLDDVRTGFKILAVNIENHVRTRANEILIASFERGAAKIRGAHVALLQHGAHGAVEHKDSLREQLAQRFAGFVQITHLME